jgi:hypothetical protein
MQKSGYLSASPQDDFTVQKVCASFAKVFNERPQVLNLHSVILVLPADPAALANVFHTAVPNPADSHVSGLPPSTVPLRI